MRRFCFALSATVATGCFIGQSGDGNRDDRGVSSSPGQPPRTVTTSEPDDPTEGDDDDGDDVDDTADTDTDPTTITQFSVAVTWIDDGNVPFDTDGDGLPDVGCGDSVDIVILDPLGELNWHFGMAQTGGPPLWTGEDCYVGYANYNICHPIGVAATLNEVTSCSVTDIVAGSRTYFSANLDPVLTYYLEDSLGNCFIWGHDPAYYGPLACMQI